MRTPKRHTMMVLYKNLSGKSKVTRYAITKDSLKIRFADCSVYLYTNQSADPKNISQMKTLALAGKGLSTFIDTNLKDRFARKVR